MFIREFAFFPSSGGLNRAAARFYLIFRRRSRRIYALSLVVRERKARRKRRTVRYGRDRNNEREKDEGERGKKGWQG